MDIENDQIINIAEDDAAVDSTYVVVSIILIFLFGKTQRTINLVIIHGIFTHRTVNLHTNILC
jgi:hypothetical protein